MTNREEGKTLDDYDDEIQNHVSNWGSYSRNIVGIILRQVDKKYGTNEANKLVSKYHLTDYGFNEEAAE